MKVQFSYTKPIPKLLEMYLHMFIFQNLSLFIQRKKKIIYGRQSHKLHSSFVGNLSTCLCHSQPLSFFPQHSLFLFHCSLRLSV